MFQFLKGENDTAIILKILNFIFGIIRAVLGLDISGGDNEDAEQ